MQELARSSSVFIRLCAFLACVCQIACVSRLSFSAHCMFSVCSCPTMRIPCLWLLIHFALAVGPCHFTSRSPFVLVGLCALVVCHCQLTASYPLAHVISLRLARLSSSDDAHLSSAFVDSLRVPRRFFLIHYGFLFCPRQTVLVSRQHMSAHCPFSICLFILLRVYRLFLLNYCALRVWASEAWSSFEEVKGCPWTVLIFFSETYYEVSEEHRM